MQIISIKLFGFEVFSIVRNGQPRDHKGRFLPVKASRITRTNGSVFRPLTEAYVNRLANVSR
jgi:hypothetical protein